MVLHVLVLFFLNSQGQIQHDSIMVEGHYRRFHFVLPREVNTNYSLVFILHGSGGNGLSIRGLAAGLEKIADAENILLVYPDGYKGFWNECRKNATHPANVENINDEVFFIKMMDYFKGRYPVIKENVFAMGVSGGGHMCYKLAMAMPARLKGISAIIGNLPTENNLDCIVTGKALPVMITNSTADELNPYKGGEMIVNNSSWGNVRSTDSTFRYWAGIAGYSGRPEVNKLPDSNPSNKQSITRFSFSGKDKPEITLLEVAGGVHAVPADIDIFVESWQFFKRQIK